MFLSQEKRPFALKSLAAISPVEPRWYEFPNSSPIWQTATSRPGCERSFFRFLGSRIFSGAPWNLYPSVAFTIFDRTSFLLGVCYGLDFVFAGFQCVRLLVFSKRLYRCLVVVWLLFLLLGLRFGSTFSFSHVCYTLGPFGVIPFRCLLMVSLCSWILCGGMCVVSVVFLSVLMLDFVVFFYGLLIWTNVFAEFFFYCVLYVWPPAVVSID